MEALQPLSQNDWEAPDPQDISHIVTEDSVNNWEAPEPPDISHIITEDDTPVDNLFSEKQQRLLTESLNSSWNPGRHFLTSANVGIFHATKTPPIVPDIFLSLDVQVADDLWDKKNRSYFLWEFGKPPEVAVEIVSNTKGGETNIKFQKYAQIGVWYYIIFDPQQLIQKDALRIYELLAGQYVPKADRRLTHIGLEMTLWEGEFEEKHGLWLRWCDKEGNLIQTGAERAKAERQRAEAERQRAEAAENQLISEKQRAERLAAKLRSLGIDPENPEL
ncbi:Uma2 family endonuclease [Desulfonema magnum]|uniref:DUF820 n=1 Tax=Desulfonema magnum TaxID=45655 RepID=A0A975BIF0_9BACT|nr:Uma2 family endonuclease [Desulfonema magnum]QTA85908.1 DUF820 [Desulfonema magnum]